MPIAELKTILKISGESYKNAPDTHHGHDEKFLKKRDKFFNFFKFKKEEKK
jgi:hypothetical protein